MVGRDISCGRRFINRGLNQGKLIFSSLMRMSVGRNGRNIVLPRFEATAVNIWTVNIFSVENAWEPLYKRKKKCGTHILKLMCYLL